MEEPWDELMGPSPEHLRKMLRSSPDAEPAVPLRRTSSTPASSNEGGNIYSQHHISDRWAKAAADSSATSINSPKSSSHGRNSYREAPFSASAGAKYFQAPRSGSPGQLDPPEEYPVTAATAVPATVTPENDELKKQHATIRQEALKVLEVADEALADSTYSVHRTASGGFACSAAPLGKKKRMPTAISGLSFKSSVGAAATNRKSAIQKQEHDREFEDEDKKHNLDETRVMMAEEAPKARDHDDNEYGEDDIVDAVGMEKRSLTSRPADDSTDKKASAWSSRYSVDNTLLALSGGSMSSVNKILKDMDRESEREVILGGSSKSPNVFGHGFNFRQKHVFGKQNVVIPPPTNLRTAYVQPLESDAGSSGLLPEKRTKTWQDQLNLEKKQRMFFFATVVVILVFFIVMAVFFTASQSRGTSGVPVPTLSDTGKSESVTFYVTCDIPLNAEAEAKLSNDMQTFNEQATFFVHLGNIQVAEQTQCPESRYTQVATILEQSPITTFIVPGQEDWKNCPNPETAWLYWFESFQFFHHNFPNENNVHVQSEYERYENFAFEHLGVLFVGLHVIDGYDDDDDDDDDISMRNVDNLNWIKAMVLDHGENIRAIVLFGNAKPGKPENEYFFRSAIDYLNSNEQVMGLPVAYVHAYSSMDNMGTVEYEPYTFGDSDNIVAIEVDQGSEASPVRITVGFGTDPFIIG